MAAVHVEVIGNDIMETNSDLSASLEDFEHDRTSPALRPSPILRFPSHHSGFKEAESDVGGDSASEGKWSPPPAFGSGWYRHQPYLQESHGFRSTKSREGSRAADEDDDPTTMPANIPLPRGSLSPAKDMSPSPARAQVKEERDTSPRAQTSRLGSEDFAGQKETSQGPSANADNYIRFAVKAEMQHRTEPFEVLLSSLKSQYSRFAASRRSTSIAVSVLLFAIVLFRAVTSPPAALPAPDLVKVAGLARSLEPLLYYSENGIQHITELQETGVAVWDLGESVRVANLSNASIIVRELDGLSSSLQSLSYELTQFCASVDADIDNVLLTMDWARRELSALHASTPSPSSFTSALSNVQTLLSTHTSLLADPNTHLPTPAGKALASLFGLSHAQRTAAALQRTFVELLSTFEDSIASELSHTTSLFALFAIIDRHFLNVQRATVRELDSQEEAHSSHLYDEYNLLSLLWRRALGSGAARLRKYEKNKNLLQSVRTQTVRNKNLLVEHNSKLVALKQNLETLRRRLVGPLVRGPTAGINSENGGVRENLANDPILGLEEQIKGLEGTYEYLGKVRESQKGRVLEMLYGRGGRRGHVGEGNMREIDGA